MAKKKGASFLLVKRRLPLNSMKSKRITKLKQIRKNNCSKLDIPASMSSLENIKMKLRPRVAEIM